MSDDRTYSDFDLMIEGDADEGYRARVLDSPIALVQGSHPITLIAISGIAQPGRLEQTKSLISEWLTDAREHYRRACAT